jgi:hypothetical protein
MRLQQVDLWSCLFAGLWVSFGNGCDKSGLGVHADAGPLTDASVSPGTGGAGRGGAGGAAGMAGAGGIAASAGAGGMAGAGGVAGAGGIAGSAGAGGMAGAGGVAGAGGIAGSAGVGGMAGAGGVAGAGGIAGVGGMAGAGGIAGAGGEGGTTVVGTGGALLRVEPPSVDFGSIDPGATREVSVWVTNVGGETSGRLETDSGPGLTATYLSGHQLAPQERTWLDITIAPTKDGAFSSWVSLSADPGATTPLQIPVTGMVAFTGPFYVTPLSHDFGTVSSSTRCRWSITVTALEPMTDLAASSSGDVTLESSGTCTASLAKSDSCEVDAVLIPKSFGPASGTVEITGGGASRKRVTVMLSAIAREGP